MQLNSIYEKICGCNHVFIVAEVGVNHNGGLDTAKKMIDIAKSVGCDAVKFQSFKAEKVISSKAALAPYQQNAIEGISSQLDMVRNLEFGREEHIALMDYCRQKDIIFLSSAFDEDSADMLEELGIEAFKIPSGEITNIPLLRHIAYKHLPIILSTGMSTLNEIVEAVNAITSCGNSEIILLHCVSAYPAPIEEVNLKAMNTLKERFSLPVGFSDHTEGIVASIAAVALGAQVIEKHFTLDKKMEGPDHKASLEPEELRHMVEVLRLVEKAIGDGEKKLCPSEKENVMLVRKSVVAVKDIVAGQRFTEQNITLKRPGYGIQPSDIDKVIGRTAKVDIKADEIVTWEKIL